jgi:hypothetical protein
LQVWHSSGINSLLRKWNSSRLRKELFLLD